MEGGMRGFGREALSMEKGHFGTGMVMCNMRGSGRLVSHMEWARCII